MNTGFYIRAKIDGRWESIDIGDTRLSADVLLRWLVTLSNESLISVIEHVREVEASNEKG